MYIFKWKYFSAKQNHERFILKFHRSYRMVLINYNQMNTSFLERVIKTDTYFNATRVKNVLLTWNGLHYELGDFSVV